MPKPLRQLTPDLSPAHRLGAELRKYRCKSGLSQKSLGDAVHVSGSMIGAIETGERISTAAVIKACDDELGAHGTLSALWCVAAKSRTRAGRPARPAATRSVSTSSPSAAGSPLDRAIAHVERSWLVRLDRASVVHSTASTGAATDRGTWVRLERCPADEIGVRDWGGIEASAALRGVTAPAWANTLTWLCEESGAVWRADEVELVDEPLVSKDAVLDSDPRLPRAWWSTWSRSMEALAEARATRVARHRRQSVSPRRVARVIEDVWPGHAGAQLSEWTCAHGDMTWRRLTRSTCWILGWDGFGLAPRGLDAATLWCSSLTVPNVAAQVWRERRADLESPTGTVMTLYVLARILTDPLERDGPLATPAREAAARLSCPGAQISA